MGEAFTWGAQIVFLIIMIKKELLSKSERFKKTSTGA